MPRTVPLDVQALPPENDESDDGDTPINLPAVPFELIEIIIDYLHDDPRTLKECALVCSSWVVPSRYHLFRSWNISASSFNNTFRATLDLTDIEDSDEHTIVMSSIRHLTIRDKGTSGGCDELFRDCIVACTEIFHSVTKLTLTEIPYLAGGCGWCTLREMVAPNGFFSSITTLEIFNLYIFAFEDIFDIISDLPALRDLRYHSYCGVREEKLTPRTGSPPVGLTTLELGYNNECLPPAKFGSIDHCFTQPLFDWLISGNFNSVEVIKLGNVTSTDWKAIGKYLAFLGSSLKCLGVELDSYNTWMDIILAHTNLDLNTQIRRIELRRFLDFEGNKFNKGRLLQIIPFLERLARNSLSQIVFFVRLEWTHLHDVAEYTVSYDELWRNIDSNLAGGEYPELKKLEFHIYIPLDDKSRIQEHIQSRFSSCSRRGISISFIWH